VGLVASLAAVGATASAGPERAVASRVVVVHRGDTVWAIASRIVGPAADPRPMVQRLIGSNHLQGGLITVGQRLVVPSA
jgi:nucleoid-associated protein YgaU